LRGREHGAKHGSGRWIMTGQGRRRARRDGRGYRWLAVLSALLVAALAAGCAGIPGSGDPREVTRVVDASEAVAPQGPDTGQQPEQIVREFIHAIAMTEYDTAGKSFVAARQFLTPSERTSWRADSGSTPVVVLADDFAARPDPEHPGLVTVSGT